MGPARSPRPSSSEDSKALFMLMETQRHGAAPVLLRDVAITASPVSIKDELEAVWQFQRNYEAAATPSRDDAIP